jgi:hypothetical protein
LTGKAPRSIVAGGQAAPQSRGRESDMGIEEQLTIKLAEAMRERRVPEINVLRMIKTAASRERTAPGFACDDEEAFWLGVIQRYVRQQTKALAEYEALGERAAAQVAEIRFELGYLAPFAPSKLGEAETAALVDAAIAETKAAGAKMVGKVVGAVMKAHKDRVDAELVKRIAAARLG